MSAAEIAEAGRRGLDIQLHTHRHIDVTMRVDELPGEIADNRAFLSAATGEGRFEHFCYPSGRFHPRAPELLAASGVRSATTTERGLNAPGSDLYALRRFLDGRRVTNLQFDAYLSGLLHFTSRFSRLIGRRARPPAQYAG